MGHNVPNHLGLELGWSPMRPYIPTGTSTVSGGTSVQLYKKGIFGSEQLRNSKLSQRLLLTTISIFESNKLRSSNGIARVSHTHTVC